MSALTLNADLASHRIEGFAHMGNTPISVPLVTKVGDFLEGELWHGGCIGGVPADEFDAIVSLYPWERYKTDPSTTVRIEFPLYDAAGEVPTEDVEWLAARVVEFLADGKRVLVHCQAGLNRSSLVVAKVLALCGIGGDLVSYIRERRCDAALCNPDFAEWVNAL